MIFFQDVYATVWETYNQRKYVGARISTGTKNRDGSYKNSYWYARFVGDCVDLARTLTHKERIKILKGAVETSYNKDKKQSYTTVVIFDFEGVGRKDDKSINENFTPVEEEVELPF